MNAFLRKLQWFARRDRREAEVQEELAWPRFERIVQDLRFGLRGLRRSPAFTLATVLTLAIGIGATSAIFSVVNGVLLKPLPFPDSDRLDRAGPPGARREPPSWAHRKPSTSPTASTTRPSNPSRSGIQHGQHHGGRRSGGGPEAREHA